MNQWLLTISALICGSSVALGAFGAHKLKELLTKNYEPPAAQKKLDQWKTGSSYQMYHGLGMLGVSILCRMGSARNSESGGAKHAFPFGLLKTSFLLFFVGTVIFSGCLYAMVLGGPKFLGAIVPIGGTCMIVGWICLATASFRLSPDG